MSKRQDKINQRIADSKDFMRERRKTQLIMFEQNYETGLRMYEQNKDKLTPEQISILEKQLQENKEILDRLRDEAYPRTEA
jgi:hypothetical protein